MQRTLSVAGFLSALPVFAGLALAQPVGGPLLQPGESYPGVQQGTIELHPPKPAHAHKPAQTARPSLAPLIIAGPSQPDEIQLHMPDHAVHRVHRARTKTATAASAGAKPQPGSAIPFSFDQGNTFAARPTAEAPTSQPASQPASPPAPPPVHVASLPAKAASAPPAASKQPGVTAPAPVQHTNMTKRASIMFDRGALAPSPVQYQAVKMLAGTLNSALESGAAGIQLEAYGGTPGDKSSDARRVALKRALAVRQLLIDDGVPSARISVRAMGGADDKGPPDRVDVFIRAG